jgi:serine/threonine protein kinase
LTLDELGLDDDSFFGGGANGHSVNKDSSSALFRHGTSGAAHAAVLRRVPSSSSSINQHASASGFQLDGTRAAALGLPIRFVALVAFELLSALRCLNDNGFSHYDVRPSNILIESGGHVVLGDFGTVRREVLMADALAPLPGGSFAGSPSGVLDTAGAREQRLQHYLPPEHLTAAGRVAAENDGCRLSDVWSFAVVLCELATGVHPFTPPNSPSPAPAHLVLQNIARLKYQPVRAEHLLPSSDESVTVRLLNDLVAECFVARAARKSADELVQLPFFSSDAVRRCAGAPPASWALPTPKFFASVVDARLLQPSPSLHPMAMCLLGGAPSAADMWEMLPIVAAAPHDVSADNFADSVDPDALVDMDTREVLDLRFFAAPTEEALSAWTEADNAAAVQDQDSQWAPDGMTARRADHHHRLRDDVRALGIAGESKMAFTYVRNRH